MSIPGSNLAKSTSTGAPAALARSLGAMLTKSVDIAANAPTAPTAPVATTSIRRSLFTKFSELNLKPPRNQTTDQETITKFNNVQLYTLLQN
jgi:hypothetical protein